jgi:hypothetical protein
MKFDEAALVLWQQVKDRRTDSLMSAVVNLLSDNNIQVLDSTLFLRDHLATHGVMTRRTPSPAEWQDIKLGFSMAKGIGGMDIGQTIVIKNGSILAVEAIEGTDQTIARVQNLAAGAIVVKTAKPKQDMRFDVPAAGSRTIDSMIRAGAAVLALEAGMVLIDDWEVMVQKADAHDISVLGVQEDDYRK